MVAMSVFLHLLQIVGQGSRGDQAVQHSYWAANGVYGFAPFSGFRFAEGNDLVILAVFLQGGFQFPTGTVNLKRFVSLSPHVSGGYLVRRRQRGESWF
jgi:hypothetical protein